jgi:hypothetical protein
MIKKMTAAMKKLMHHHLDIPGRGVVPYCCILKMDVKDWTGDIRKRKSMKGKGDSL